MKNVVRRVTKQFLALLLCAIMVCTQMPIPVFAKTLKDPYTGKTLTHDSKFDNYTMKYGVDVSKWNEDVDWKAVKADGIDFAFVRVGNRMSKTGELKEDPYYKQNLTNAVAAGVDVGVYIYSQAITKAEAVEEANYILSRIKSYDVTLPVVFDFEYFTSSSGRLYDAHLTVSEATAVCRAFCEKVEEAGYTPIIYANRTMFSNNLNAASLAEDYMIWLASYNTSTLYSGDYDIWQYTESAVVDGINGVCDCNVWYVPAEATSVNISASSATMNVGDTKKLTATVSPSNSTDKITWTSSDPVVAYVDSSGNVKAGYKGTTTIKATTTSGVSASCKVTVYDNMSNYTISPFTATNYTYTGSAIKPTVTVKTKNKVAVSATVKSSLNMRSGPGTDYKVVTSMAGGTEVKVFNAFDMGEKTWYSVEAKIGTKTYRGYCSGAYLNLTEGYRTLSMSDYTTSYSNNINIGVANAVATGKSANYVKGSISRTYTIVNSTSQTKVNLSEATITSISTKTYTGSAIKPAVTVKYNNNALVNGRDYTVSYSSNTNIGKATVKVTGINAYTGTKVVTFNIVPKNITGLTYSERTANSITIKWTKASQVSGYEVYRATAYNGTYKKVSTITNTSTVTYKNKSLTSGREYYYKVRAYKNVSGKKYYGNFSSIYSIYTKSAYSNYAIAKNTYKVRIHAGDSYSTRGSISSGKEYKILATAYDKNSVKWYKISYKVGTTTYNGYVKSSWVRVENTGKVTANTLYVRSNAGTSYKAVGVIKKNKSVRITGNKTDSRGVKWYKVRYKSGTKTITGYASSRYIKLY